MKTGAGKREGNSSDLLSGGLCSTGTGGTWPRLGKGNVEAVGPQNEGALEMEHSPQGGGFSGLGQGSCSGGGRDTRQPEKKSQRHGGHLSLSPSD